MSCCRYGGAQMGFGSYVVCMERSGIRDDQCHEAPDSATLHPGYLLLAARMRLTVLVISSPTIAQRVWGFIRARNKS
jgi:hypothetical protein